MKRLPLSRSAAVRPDGRDSRSRPVGELLPAFNRVLQVRLEHQAQSRMIGHRRGAKSCVPASAGRDRRPALLYVARLGQPGSPAWMSGRPCRTACRPAQVENLAARGVDQPAEARRWTWR